MPFFSLKTIALIILSIFLSNSSFASNMERGNAYLNTHQYDLAITEYSKEIETNQRSAMAYYQRAVCYWYKSEYDSAIADLSKGIDIEPKFVFAFNLRGLIYYLKGKYELAMADLIRAVELSPKIAINFFHLAYVHHKLRNKEKATEEFLKAKEIDNDIVRKRATFLEKPMHSRTKEFYAEEILCASDYLEVPGDVIKAAKKILGKEIISPSAALPSPKLVIGKVTSIHGDIIECDLGSGEEVRIGETGRVFYKVTIDEKEKRVYLAMFKITHISPKSFMAKIENKVGEVKVGHLVEIVLENR